MRYFKLLFLSGASLLVVTGLYGQLEIRVDFGINSPSGGNWNNVGGGTSTSPVDLVDFNTGLDTGIDAGTGAFNASTGANFSKGWFTGSATDDLVFTTQNLANIAFLNNVPTGSYTLEILFTSNDGFSPDQYGGNFYLTTSGNQNANRTENGTPVPAYWNALDDGFTPQNWLIFDEVTPNGSGQIVIQGEKIAGFMTGGFNSLGINALRLTAVPELSASAFITGACAFAWVAFGARRRFKG